MKNTTHTIRKKSSIGNDVYPYPPQVLEFPNKIIYNDYENMVIESNKLFNEKYSNLKRRNYYLKPTTVSTEGIRVKIAKLIIYNYYKSINKQIYNEICARKLKSTIGYTPDLYDVENKFCIEINWKHKKINHKKMVVRLKRYRHIFGNVQLLLLQWENKMLIKGFKFMTLEIRDRYKKNKIKVDYFNITYPNFDFLKWIR